MEKLKPSIFDFFAYTLPGAFALMGCYIVINMPINNLSSIIADINKINLYTSFFILGASYIFGFTLDSIASVIYYKIFCKLYKRPIKPKGDSNSDFSKMKSKIIHESKENFEFTQKWKALKTMSHNLAFSSLIVGVTCFINSYKLAKTSNFEWLFIGTVLLLFVPILLQRAHVFDRWHYQDLKNAYESISKKGHLTN